jgi:murein DD-endopeptidase MepM/ murein hydrolase activator NlpD
VLILVIASSPAIAQRVPGWLFPVLGVVGGALLALAFGRSVRAFVRGDRRGARVVWLLVTAVAAALFVVSPGVRLLSVLTTPRVGPPLVLAGFGDWRGSEGYPRLSPHRGLDIAGPIGADVLAAADGRVTVARDNRDLCGLIVVIVHDRHGYRTVYCHLGTLAVQPGDSVARGQRIGVVGTTGQRAWPGYEHVHLELQRGADSKHVEDPRPRLVGCFDARTTYPSSRLVLTYPVQCRAVSRAGAVRGAHGGVSG